MNNDIRFLLSCDVALKVQLRIETLDGNRLDSKDEKTSEVDDRKVFSNEVYAICQIYVDGQPIGPPVRTKYQPFQGTTCRWVEWLTFPVEYKDLSLDSHITITIWEMPEPRNPHCVGGTAVRLFGKNRTLKMGNKELKIWEGRPGDRWMLEPRPRDPSTGEMDRLQKLLKKHCQKEKTNNIEWLDKLTFRKIEEINQRCEGWHKGLSLFVTLPTVQEFKYPVIFQEERLEAAMPSRNHTPDIILVDDPDLCRDNPVENRQRKLARALHRGLVDRYLRPNVEERKQINELIQSPYPRALTNDEKDLLWKYRFSLQRDKKALTKFLRSVDWNDLQEAQQALELMESWEECDTEDVLELLSDAFTHREVRNYALKRLQKEKPATLCSYLLQLVAALRYEVSNSSDLARFLIKKGTEDPVLGHYLHWYLLVEQDRQTGMERFAHIHNKFVKALGKTPEGRERLDQLRRQEILIRELTAINKELRESRESRPQRIERLQAALRNLQEKLFAKPMDLPLDPTVKIIGFIPEEATIFKSQMSPLRITFLTDEEQGRYCVIFKSGDDLRQDQLVIQIITLMDRLLKKDALDLKLTPYRVLATSQKSGIVQYIPSFSLAKVLADNRNDLLQFFRKHSSNVSPALFSPNNKQPIAGIKHEVFDTFMKSCAGYCVISYVLGIGDRHLDNLMLTTAGAMFHIDFGYLLGRDPKPLPPPMKICKEMVQALGGPKSGSYLDFRKYCSEAYNILRHSTGLFVNLIGLMGDAGLPDIDSSEKTILKLLERFHPEMDDEKAVAFMQNSIDDSVNAMFPLVTDAVHNWMQYWTS